MSTPVGNHTPKKPMTYGLTGGIGTGKSTVALMFSVLGIACFDADHLGRQLLADDSVLQEKISERFPDCYRNQEIDRARLATRVFSQQTDRRWLENLLHPFIWQKFLNECIPLLSPQQNWCLLEGAVLLESATRFDLAGMVIVTAPQKVRLQRLRERDGQSEAQLKLRMAAQMNPADKILHAHYLIDNGGRNDRTRDQVAAVCALLTKEQGGPA